MSGTRPTSPTTATSIVAVTTSMPGIVINRRTSSSPRTCCAMTASICASSSPRKSSWRRHPSTVKRSSIGRTCSAIHTRPFAPNGSAAGLRPLRLQCSTALISFLDLRAALDQPAATRHEPTQHPRALVTDPHLRDQIRCEQAGEHLGVDPVGLHPRVTDRADLPWRAQAPSRRHAIAGSARSPARGRSPPSRPGLSAPSSARTTAGARASSRSCPPSAPSRRQRSRPDRSRDARPARSICPPHTSRLEDNTSGERWTKQHLRIRARSAPGQVAEAASYTNGLAAHKNGSACPPLFSQRPCPRTREPTTQAGRSQRLRAHSHAGTPRYGT